MKRITQDNPIDMYMHQVALAYALRIYSALLDVDLISAVVGLTGTYQEKKERNIYDFQFWFDITPGRSVVVHIVLEKTLERLYSFRFVKCDIPIYGTVQNYAIVSIVPVSDEDHSFRDALRIKFFDDRQSIVI